MLAALISVAAGVGLAIILLGSSASDSGKEPPPEIVARGVDLTRHTIYKSPQRPGYTAWTGAWTMPDKSLMVAFTQATGPVDVSRRARVSAALRRRVGANAIPSGYDFSGLRLGVEYLRSTDGGGSWKRVREDRYNAPVVVAYTPQATLALPDGTLIRRVNGYDVWSNKPSLRTAYLQRLAPGAKRWSKPQILLDPKRFMYQISRIRRLTDGRLIALGGAWNTPAGTPLGALPRARRRWLLMVSEDQGKTWKGGMKVSPQASAFIPNEWDAAELPNGDLLAVLRTRDRANPRVHVRRQATLRKDDGGWTMTDVRKPPFPHSGHPELLRTREGVILHIADTGIHYTSDGGRRWRRLRFNGKVAVGPDVPDRYKSEYYPRAVQAADGTIHVFGHVGADDPYGARDQAIVEDRFRLVTRRR